MADKSCEQLNNTCKRGQKIGFRDYINNSLRIQYNNYNAYVTISKQWKGFAYAVEMAWTRFGH